MNHKFFYSLVRKRLISAILRVQLKKNQAIPLLFKKKIFSFLILSGFLTACTLPTGGLPQNLPSRGGLPPFHPSQQPYPYPPGHPAAGGAGTAANPSANPAAGGAGGNPNLPAGAGARTAAGFPPPQPRLDSAGERNVSGFLYDLTPDTVVSLTCPFNNVLRNDSYGAFFGAYSNPGLRLSREFQRSNRISSNDPHGKVRQIIERSQFKNSVAQLGLQREGDLRILATSPSGGNPIVKSFPPINHSTTLDQLSRLRSVFTSRSSSSRQHRGGGRLEVGLPLQGGDFLAIAPLLYEDSGFIITLTYRPTSSKSFVYDEENTPYGKGYKLEYEDHNEINYLVDIYEEDLPTAEETGEWECPDALRFQVHRKGVNRREDSRFNTIYEQGNRSLNNSNFYSGTADDPINWEGHCDTSKPRNPSAQERRFFETVFGSYDSSRLPFEIGTVAIWSGGINNGTLKSSSMACIKFKGAAGCYGFRDDHYYRMEFDPDKNCEILKDISRDWKNPKFYRICPAYLSACYRR